ncbi:MAG: hypothetical protein HYT79_10885 [Elusimicrobia bacterium]|nr:hypothetical protein [Elusimicrobiota bacterium]
MRLFLFLSAGLFIGSISWAKDKEEFEEPAQLQATFDGAPVQSADPVAVQPSGMDPMRRSELQYQLEDRVELGIRLDQQRRMYLNQSSKERIAAGGLKAASLVLGVVGGFFVLGGAAAAITGAWGATAALCLAGAGLLGIAFLLLYFSGKAKDESAEKANLYEQAEYEYQTNEQQKDEIRNELLAD